MGKFALLIGVSDSSEEDLPKLPSAIEDIQAMQAVMQDPKLGDFDSVEVLSNPTRQEMEEAIETLFANRKKEDLVLFYFSGHGITDEKGKLYLVTPQTRKERGNLIKATAVAATVLHDNMGNSRSKHQVLILDSCFSGAIAEGLTGKSAGSKVDIQRELGGEGRAILTSSNAVQRSFHIQGYNLSIYTHYLIDGIQTGAANQDGDDYISVDELHEYAKKKLEQEAPLMSPQFFPVKEGYKIRLVRSPKPKGDPEVEDYKEAEVRLYQNERNWTEVIIRGESILKIDSNNTSIRKQILRAYIQRANDYILKGEFDLATSDLQSAYSLDTECAIPYYKLGMIYHSQKNYEKAVFEYDRAIKLESSNTFFWSERGKAVKEILMQSIASGKSTSFSREELEQYVFNFNKAIEITEQSMPLNESEHFIHKEDLYTFEEYVYDSKHILLNENISENLQDMKSAYLAYLAQEQAETYYHRAKFYEMAYMYGKAYEDCQKAVEIRLTPGISNGDITITEDKGFLAKKNSPEVLQMFKEVGKYFHFMGVICYFTKQYEVAIHHISQAISVNSSNSFYYRERAINYREKGDVNAAILDLTKAISLEPENSEYYFLRSDLYAGLGAHESATNDLQIARRLDPEREYRNTLAVILVHQFKDKKIIKRVVHEILDCDDMKSDIDKANCFVIRAGLRQAIGDRRNAQIDMQKAKEYGYPIGDIIEYFP